LTSEIIFYRNSTSESNFESTIFITLLKWLKDIFEILKKWKYIRNFGGTEESRERLKTLT